MADTRIDKYLWAIRAFKTRSEATDACKGNRVRQNDEVAKPSRAVHVGDLLQVRKGAVQYTWRVRALLEKRVGAAQVPDFAENLTPESELEKLHAPVETFFVRRERGAGRPTKKDRREIDSLWENFRAGDFDDGD